MTRATAFTQGEALICTMARMAEEDKLYWVGGGGPGPLALVLAQRTHASNLVFMTEDGSIGQQAKFPIASFMYMVSARGNFRALCWADMNTGTSHDSGGAIEYALLATLQIDPYGNINSSMTGKDYAHPERRFGGAGGANEMAALCWRTVIVTNLEKRKFVPRLDFVTTPGYLDGSPNAREKAGMPTGTGPYRVVTPEAVFGYDEKTHYMKLIGLAEWSTVDEVLSNMSFKPLIADKLEKLAPPTEEELVILRSELDPGGRTSGEGKWINLE
ncbi:MAG: hypothetical protein PHR56_01330 [Dehalococcoidales bacterium]|nr:hypothetical protein [Dehalococcoidales bacterium]